MTSNQIDNLLIEARALHVSHCPCGQKAYDMVQKLCEIVQRQKNQLMLNGKDWKGDLQTRKGVDL